MNKRSRRGCVACLKHHRKCDEVRPTCGRCVHVGAECDYRRTLRWFNGTRLTRSRKRRTDETTTTQETEQVIVTGTADQPLQWNAETPAPAVDSTLGGGDERRIEGGSGTPDAPTDAQTNSMSISYIATPYPPHDESLDESKDSCPDGNMIYLPEEPPEPGLHDQQTHFPVAALGDDRIEELQITSSPNQNSDASWSIYSPFDTNLPTMLFQDDGRYIAYVYFVRSVAQILPGWNGVRNGYRQIATMALSSPMLLDTIISVATVYMQLRGIVPDSVALHRQSQALASLRRNINALSDSASTATAAQQATCSGTSVEISDEAACLKRNVLATILLQITVEIANGTSFIQVHIAHALDLFRELGYDRGRPMSPIGQVLLQRMTYIDVLSSIFWHRRPLLPISFWFYNQRAQEDSPDNDSNPDDALPTFQETTGCPLWVISHLARISHLIADAKDGVPNEVIIPMAYQLDGDLTMSARCYYGDNGPSPLSSNTSTYQQASHTHQEARDPGKPRTGCDTQRSYLTVVGKTYYWSTTLLLQIRLLRDPQASPRVQFCLSQLLGLIQSLPLGCGPDSQLSLPLYAAALAAVREEDRQIIRNKSVKLCDIYPMKTRGALTKTFEAIWDDMDERLLGIGDYGMARCRRLEGRRFTGSGDGQMRLLETGGGDTNDGGHDYRNMQVAKAVDLMKEGCLFIC